MTAKMAMMITRKRGNATIDRDERFRQQTHRLDSLQVFEFVLPFVLFRLEQEVRLGAGRRTSPS